jgi:predicted ATPase/class 3 adenylate cyclase/Tfp pilus assembly protein PilF
MRPTTRALLLTDIVDSTQLAEALGDVAAARAWAAHDRAARDLLAMHRGREIDKTDGFLLLFEQAADAAAYALAYHRAMAALDPPLRARAGLHVGPVILTENLPADVLRGAKPLEVDGIAKPMAARIMALARAGQTLLSQAACQALDSIPPGCELRAHGHYRLKGLAEPMELSELGVPGVSPLAPPADTPKAYRVVHSEGVWKPAHATRHSLPAERDPFVGRRSELAELARRIDDGARLVSVLGIGGVGKTRLVTHYGWTWLGALPGGVWFCDLADARSEEGICSAVARALDVPLGPGDPVVQLGHAVAGRGPCLLILDNFEQVVGHAPATLARWLDRANQAQFVVTTRNVLGLPGETTLALAPLHEAEAVELFAARARQAQRDFVLTEADRPHVTALVQLLDTLPLAIELAAARVRLMSPKVLRKRMSERFELLTSSGGRQTRQSTLRAALDWSWELLAPDEQQALAQLSVFEGGFSLDAATAVLSLSQMGPLDALQSLVDKSLLYRNGDERLAMLVSVHEYAQERLHAFAGPAQAEARHGAHFAALGQVGAIDALETHGGVALRRALAPELENLVAACRRATTRGDGPTAVATLAAAGSVLLLKGPLLTLADLGARVAGLVSLSRVERGRTLRVLGEALRQAGRMDEALLRYREALATACEEGDRSLESVVLGLLGDLHNEQGRRDEALAHLQQAIDIARATGQRRLEGVAVSSLGTRHAEQGRREQALGCFLQALALHREVGNRRFEGVALGNLGPLYGEQGCMADALQCLQEALAIQREVGDRRYEGWVLANLGVVHETEGRMAEALQCGEQALAIHREVGNRRSEGFSLANLGGLLQDQGRMHEALEHFRAALEIHRELGNRRAQGMALASLGGVYQALGQIERAREALAAGEALLREAGDPYQLARLLNRRLSLEHAEGRLDVAGATLAEAEALAIKAGAGEGSALGQGLRKSRAMLGVGVGAGAAGASGG